MPNTRTAAQLVLCAACGIGFVTRLPMCLAEEGLPTDAAQSGRSSVTVNKPLLNAPQKIAPSHPLWAVMKFARAEKSYLERKVQSVSCRVVKRERIDDELQEHQYVEMELQEQIRDGNAMVRPMRVYLSFLGPAEVKGRRVLFVEGANDGKMLVRKGGKRFNYAVLRIDPMGDSARRESLVPITDLGFGRLLDQQLRVLETHARIDPTGKNTKVQHTTKAKINGRLCELIRVTHPKKQSGLTFHMANVYIDNELHVPVRIDASDWPQDPDGEPPLLAEYTYTDVRLNVDFPEATFDADRLKQ